MAASNVNSRIWNHPRALAVLLSVLVVLGFAAATFALYHSFDVQRSTDRKLCQAAVDNRDAVRITWDSARDIILAGQTDPGTINRTNDFFNGVLKLVPPLKCASNEAVESG